MNRYLVVSMLVLGLAACSPTPTIIPVSPTPTSEIPPTIPATAAPQEALSTSTLPPLATEPLVPDGSGALWLQILSPQDEAIVNLPYVDVIGSAPAGAVVSVNEEILLVGADQQFKTTLSLEEGPNLIEIVASDEDGNETSLLLTLTYEP